MCIRDSIEDEGQSRQEQRTQNYGDNDLDGVRNVKIAALIGQCHTQEEYRDHQGNSWIYNAMLMRWALMPSMANGLSTTHYYYCLLYTSDVYKRQIMLFLIGATTLLASDDKDHNEGGGLW